MLKKDNLILHQQERDGHCLFRSVAEAVKGDPRAFPTVRKELATFYRNDRSLLLLLEGQIVPVNDPQRRSAEDTYIRNIQTVRVNEKGEPLPVGEEGWGGQVDMQALVNCYNARSSYSS